MTDIEIIKKLIKEGELDLALSTIANCIVIAAITPNADKSEYYYLMGNVYRKKGEFGKAMEFYTRAVDENPDSPAKEAREALHSILSFYNKDMYNH